MVMLIDDVTMRKLLEHTFSAETETFPNDVENRLTPDAIIALFLGTGDRH